MVRLLLGSKISDIASGAMSGSYSNGPATVLDHFRMEFRYLAHHSNMRSEQLGLAKFCLLIPSPRQPSSPAVAWASGAALLRYRGVPAHESVTVPKLNVVAVSELFGRFNGGGIIRCRNSVLMESKRPLIM